MCRRAPKGRWYSRGLQVITVFVTHLFGEVFALWLDANCFTMTRRSSVTHDVTSNVTQAIPPCSSISFALYQSVCLAVTHLLPVHRKRSRAVTYDHPDGHDALRREEDVRPNDVVDANQGAHAPPPQVSGHANKVDDAASADPPR